MPAEARQHDHPTSETTQAVGAADPNRADVEAPSGQPGGGEPVYSVFTTWEKRGIALGAAAGGFFSPFTAQIYFPALNVLASDFNVSITQMNLTVTAYMVSHGAELDVYRHC